VPLNKEADFMFTCHASVMLSLVVSF